MPLLPAIFSAIPSLISAAEGLFGGSKDGEKTGDLKKAFVMKALEAGYDRLNVGKILPDLPNVDEKRLVLRTCEVWIEELLPAVLGGK